ncbi:quinol:electron acceptor oxidoreductase subunit ActD [Haliangium sp.]|uniref:quinol:electron acceptor oxidoreductase subunit ActD n=1 Tax=Haliangium sp. TaxID=2663208 RepID=UPI003D119E60
MSDKDKAKDEPDTKAAEAAEAAEAEATEAKAAESADSDESDDAADSEAAESDAASDDAEAEETDEDESDDAEAEESDEIAASGGDDGAEAGGADEEESGELFGLLAEFDTPGQLIAAAEKVRDAGYTQWDCYSPFPVHGIDPAMGIKRTILPVVVFVIGLCGLGGGLLLQWWTNAFDWPWIVSGKPFFSLPANIPITFEATILASVFASFFGMWALNKLPQHWHPFFKKDSFRRATDDGFFIGIEAADKVFQRGKAQALLEQAGACQVESCFVSRDPQVWAVPRPLMGFVIVSCMAALVPFALIAKARADKSDTPRVHVWSDMDFQPKAKAQTASKLYGDQRASRAPAEGTIARGALKADDHFYRGMQGDQWATSFPAQVEISMDTIEHGRERFGIYCQPCHGAAGEGDGMIQQRTTQLGRNVRGWVQPSNLHQGSIVRQPHGQIFNTISHGIRTMPGYATQLPEGDRWAIVLYLRALQRSQNANLDDVPADARQQIRQ